MIFYIYGTDNYLVREKTAEIRNGFISKKDKGGFNVIKLTGEEITTDRFTQEVLTVPFLSEKKLIVVTDLCSDFSAGKKKLKDEIFTFLKAHQDKLENNLLFTDVFEEEKKIPQKDQLFNLLKSQQYAWYLPALKNADLNNWLKKYCAKNDIRIEPAAAAELLTMVGNDLLQLDNELNKLKNYSAEPITKEAVRLLVRAKYDDDVFQLTDALAAKNRRAALELIANQLLSGNEPLSLLGSINWQFKTMLKIKSLLEDNPRQTAFDISSKTGLHSFVVSKNLATVKKFTLAELIKIQNDLIEIETNLKSGSKNPELLFDLFVAKNC